MAILSMVNILQIGENMEIYMKAIRHGQKRRLNVLPFKNSKLIAIVEAKAIGVGEDGLAL